MAISIMALMHCYGHLSLVIVMVICLSPFFSCDKDTFTQFVNFQCFLKKKRMRRETQQFKENKQLSINMHYSLMHLCRTVVHTPLYLWLHNACVGP